MRNRFGMILTIILFVTFIFANCGIADEKKPDAPLTDAERAVKMVPTTISGTYRGGELIHLRVQDRMAFVVKPTGKIDPDKRWLWEFPFWLGTNDGFSNLQHRNYLEQA